MSADLNDINEAVARLFHLADILVDDLMEIDRGVDAALDARLDRLDSTARIARDLALATHRQIEADFKAIGSTCCSTNSIDRAATAKPEQGTAAFPERAEAYELAGQMEEPVRTISDLSRALCFICETLEESVGTVIQRIAFVIGDECNKIEAKRGQLFDLTHPTKRQSLDIEGGTA
jgi:hypothetical protein